MNGEERIGKIAEKEEEEKRKRALSTLFSLVFPMSHATSKRRRDFFFLFIIVCARGFLVGRRSFLQ